MNKQPEIPDLSGLMGALAGAASKIGSGKTEKPAWWYTFSYPEAKTIEIGNLISFTKTALFFNALIRADEQVYELIKEHTPQNGSKETFLNKIQKDNNYKLIYSTQHIDTRNAEYFLAKENAGLYIKIYGEWNNEFAVYVNCVSTNKDDINKITDILKK